MFLSVYFCPDILRHFSSFRRVLKIGGGLAIIISCDGNFYGENFFHDWKYKKVVEGNSVKCYGHGSTSNFYSIIFAFKTVSSSSLQPEYRIIFFISRDNQSNNDVQQVSFRVALFLNTQFDYFRFIVETHGHHHLDHLRTVQPVFSTWSVIVYPWFFKLCINVEARQYFEDVAPIQLLN